MKAYLTPGTAPGVREETLAHTIASVKSKGVLTFAATGTSQEGTDEETIRAIVLSSKRAGVDIFISGMLVILVWLYLKIFKPFRLR